jgi:lactate permease
MDILIALVPLLTALLMLAVLQKSSRLSGLVTVGVTILLVLLPFWFNLNFPKILISIGTGIGTALVVLYVLFPSLWLYRLQQAAGGIEILARAIARLCPQTELQILLLVLGLAPFVESVSGFGVGTVIIIPFLLALKISPLKAAMLGLLGQLAVPWGALAVGTELGARLTGLNPAELGANTAIINSPLPFIYGLVALGIGGGSKAVWRWGWVAGLAGGLLVLGEWYFSLNIGAELAGVLAALPVILLILVLSNLFRPVRPTQTIETGSSRLQFWQAIFPYTLLTFFLLLTRLFEPLRLWLRTNFVWEVRELNLAIPVLYSPGFWVFVSALIAVFVLKLNWKEQKVTLGQSWRQFAPGAIAIICFIATGQLMRDSGMTTTLSLAAASLGDFYAFVAPVLGAIGGWLTGSNAGSNAMFAPLQQEVSRRIGLPLDWIMAGQNAAGSHSTMVSPARIILATSTVGLKNSEGKLLRLLGGLMLFAILVIALILQMIVLLF